MKLIVPNEIRYGLQERHDTYTKKLGFMMYANKPNGTYGQQVSFDGWRDNKIEPKDIGNEYKLGFVLNKGHLNKYHFGASAKFRVFHPEGFEFEISLENLSLILDHSVISYGEIQVPCCIAWEGANVYLLPKVDLKEQIEVEYFDVLMNKSKAEKRLQKINSSGKPLSVRSLTSGKIVEDTEGNRYLVSAPTKSNYSREKTLPMWVVKGDNGFHVKCQFGNEYSIVFDENYSKMYYPLSETSTVINKNTENTFIKFVEREDLSKVEEKNLSALEDSIVMQFSPEQSFVSLDNSKTAINNFVDGIVKKYASVKLSSFREENGAVLMLDQVVKIKNRLYHVVLGRSYRFGYGSNVFEGRLKDINGKMQELTRSSYYHEKMLQMYFVPLTHDSKEYKGFNPNKQNSICVYLRVENEKTPKEYVNLILEERESIKEGLQVLFQPITQEEVDSQKRIYLDA